MLLRIEDFNNADAAILGEMQSQWDELQGVLQEMPLHLKASDQAGIQGKPIWDPVGTNEHIKSALTKAPLSWRANIPIPTEYSFLGTDVDFAKGGLLVEVQFSNYPFLLNNILRTELFFKSGIALDGGSTKAAVIVTKAHMFPASNSTLYYEQAKDQLSALAKNNVFDVPIRLVGLFEDTAGKVRAQWTEYENPRYSRTVVKRGLVECVIDAGRSQASRCKMRVAEASE